jgi:hypothetical protein
VEPLSPVGNSSPTDSTHTEHELPTSHWLRLFHDGLVPEAQLAGWRNAYMVDFLHLLPEREVFLGEPLFPVLSPVDPSLVGLTNAAGEVVGRLNQAWAVFYAWFLRGGAPVGGFTAEWQPVTVRFVARRSNATLDFCVLQTVALLVEIEIFESEDGEAFRALVWRYAGDFLGEQQLPEQLIWGNP